MTCFCMCFPNNRRNNYHYLSNKSETKSNIYTALPIIVKPLKNPRFYKTTCDHQASTYDELSFREGDILEVEVFSNEVMWRAKHANSSLIKFVHRDMLSLGSIYEMNKWFFKNIDRLQAEELLLSPGNVKGSFLVRKRIDVEDQFVLSVRCQDHNFETLVKHYKINKGNLGYYISNGLNFDAIETLITAYTQDTHGLMGLYQSLKVPCLNNSSVESTF